MKNLICFLLGHNLKLENDPNVHGQDNYPGYREYKVWKCSRCGGEGGSNNGALSRLCYYLGYKFYGYEFRLGRILDSIFSR